MNEIEYSIDWLTISGTRSLVQKFVGYGIDLRMETEETPYRFYNQAWNLHPAGQAHISESVTQGSMIQFTGQNMITLRENGLTDKIMLEACVQLGTITRLDYALDIFGDIALTDIDNAVLADEHKTVFKTLPEKFVTLDKQEKGTRYFGSKTAERRIRIYDKAHQMKLLNQAWHRVEFQSRKGRAHLLAKDMIEHGIPEAGNSAIRQCLDFPTISWWLKATQAKGIKLSTIPKAIPQFQKWLETQVKPSIIKRHQETQHKAFIEQWLLGLFNDLLGIDEPSK